MRRMLLLSIAALMVFVLACQPVSAVTCPVGEVQDGWCDLTTGGCNDDGGNSRVGITVQAINIHWWYNPDQNRWKVEIPQSTEEGPQGAIGEAEFYFRGDWRPTYGNYGVYWYLPGSYRNRVRFGDKIVTYSSTIRREFTMFGEGTIFSGIREFRDKSIDRCLAQPSRCPRVIVAGSVRNIGVVCSVYPPVEVPAGIPAGDVLPEDSSS